jgi:non-heme chloroperoxidase
MSMALSTPSMSMPFWNPGGNQRAMELQSRLSSLRVQVIWCAATEKENVRNIVIVRSAQPSTKPTLADVRGFIKVGQENSTSIELYYEDHGSGPPVVLIHGWPLNGDAWEKQTAALPAAGHRVIAYDRRGFGRSSKPAIGYNYDTFAADLDAVLCALDLTDVSLVGHSMGTGEITRYIGKFGTKRLRKAVLVGTLGPYLVKAPDNPEGIDASVFSRLRAGIKADRPATMMEFLKNF